MADFGRALAKTLKHEGGSVHRKSTGEVANFGITHWFLRSIGELPENPRSVPASPDEINRLRFLRRWEAIGLYFVYFWEPLRLSEFDSQELADKVFDLQVNTGRGARFLQEALNRLKWPKYELKVDGIIGPRTLASVNDADPEDTLEQLRKVARAYYISLNSTDEAAWLARLDQA